MVSVDARRARKERSQKLRPPRTRVGHPIVRSTRLYVRAIGRQERLKLCYKLSSITQVGLKYREAMGPQRRNVDGIGRFCSLDSKSILLRSLEMLEAVYGNLRLCER